jgi:hypothetical protein
MRAAFGALKWTPTVFWAATLTEFLDAIEGLNEANGGKKADEAPSEEALDDLVARYGG